MDHSLKKVSVHINGMHCASCEVLIERKFKKVPGVKNVRVDHTSGKAELFCSAEPDISLLNQSIEKDGYTVSRDASGVVVRKNTARDYVELGAIFLIVVALYLILTKLNLVPSIGVSENMSYGLVFMIGLVAAMSTCIAVTGGLLIAVAAKYKEKHPELTGKDAFRPHIYFNFGRVVSYTVLGGAVGALGSVLTLSPKVNGLVTIGVSIIMILLGFQLLHLFPGLRRFQPKMPKFIAHRIHDLSESDNKRAAFFLGAGTFFLPCGFTQALQLYVLSTGSFATGALTMFFFSLGTLPALLSLSAVSSFAKGNVQRYFLKFAGVSVLMIGFFNIDNGLALAGSTIGTKSPRVKETAAVLNDPNVEIVNGKQIVRMKVVGYNYYPHQFTIRQGMPVEWRIEGSKAEGCGRVITAPRLGITEYLPPQGEKVITFTPDKPGTIPFNCTMGMMTRGAGFTVVAGDAATPDADVPSVEAAPQTPAACNPAIQNCLEKQALQMEISNERGFYPNEFTVKQGVPVELTIDSKVRLGGCMSVMVIPEYDVTLPLKLGLNTLRFTPTKPGALYATCSMGIEMIRFNVRA